MTPSHESVHSYIESFSPEIREILKQVRAIIMEAAPQAEESVAYQMPAYKLCGHPLVYFAGFAKHIGLYALPSGHQHFKEELSRYKQGKGSVQFPLSDPIPYELIKKIVLFRADENIRKYGEAE